MKLSIEVPADHHRNPSSKLLLFRSVVVVGAGEAGFKCGFVDIVGETKIFQGFRPVTQLCVDQAHEQVRVGVFEGAEVHFFKRRDP